MSSSKKQASASDRRLRASGFALLETTLIARRPGNNEPTLQLLAKRQSRPQRQAKAKRRKSPRLQWRKPPPARKQGIGWIHVILTLLVLVTSSALAYKAGQIFFPKAPMTRTVKVSDYRQKWSPAAPPRSERFNSPQRLGSDKTPRSR